MPGTFNMLGAKLPVTITKAYELAQTQTTQMQWSVIQVLLGKTDPNKINPSFFKTGSGSEILNIKGIDIQMKPDHPVERVSYDDIIEWITGLNKLSEDVNDEIQKEIQRVIPGHKKGMVYDLPTEAQWAFVMQNRGKNNEIYFDKSNAIELDQYAWYSETSKSKEYPNGSTQSVASKKPREIDRGDGLIVKFYDLEGNVYEWNKDLYADQLAGGLDPQGATSGSFRVIRSASWYYNSNHLRADNRHGGKSSGNHRSEHFGFRLSRTNP